MTKYALRVSTLQHTFPSVLALMICLSCSIGAQTRRPVAPKDDVQNWNDIQVTIPVNKKIDFNLNSTLRVGDNVSELVDERAGFGFSFKVNKYLTLTPSYVYIAMQQPETRRRAYENRLSFAATIRLPSIKKLTISDRNLVERRLLSSRPDTARYRNRLQLEHPARFLGGGGRVFVSDEVFYDGAARAWTRNRFAIGVSRSFEKRFVGDIYYMRQNDGRSRPGDLHIIGSTLRVRL